MQNAQDAGRGRGSEALGLREKVCFRVLFESLHGRGTADVGGSWFHRVGADTQKALSPKVLSLDWDYQLVLVRGPEGPQGGVGVEEVREVTGGQSMEGLVCEE